MTGVCAYFQVHQPFRLRKYSVFDIGEKTQYFDEVKNKELIKKIAAKCYLPANKLLLRLLSKHPSMRVAFSITGCALDQFKAYAPEVLESFQDLAETEQVEFLGETYYHSLAFLFDTKEFTAQVSMHKDAMKDLFGIKPTVFRHTELVYRNDLAIAVSELGFSTVLAEGADKILGGKSPNHVYSGPGKVSLLLKNYCLSDDLAFRFGNKSWKHYPLKSDQFADWVVQSGGDTVNLFMDYETFGEHQWEDTGIFGFLEALPQALLQRGLSFHTPSSAGKLTPVGYLDVPHAVSWADTERDLSAWLGNKMQVSAAHELYKLKAGVLATGNKDLLETWRRLTTSDHFYYMCTKWFSDGDVHKYFNPYESPYDCYIAFMNVLQDIALRSRQSVLPQEWVSVA